jgi:hypothetical protein
MAASFFRALGASSYTFAALQYLEPHALKSDARKSLGRHAMVASAVQDTSGSTSSSLRTIMKPL